MAIVLQAVPTSYNETLETIGKNMFQEGGVKGAVEENFHKRILDCNAKN